MCRRLPVHFDEIAQTPHLREGDALLFRMDLFHQTQDTETERVALSLRMVDNELPCTRANFEVMMGNEMLYRMLGPMRREAMGACWAEHEELTYREMRALLPDEAHPAKPEPAGAARL